jgi:hypothetical protein
MYDDEDEDDFEDDFFFEQSHYRIDSLSDFSPEFTYFMNFLFRDINNSFSLKSETMKQEILTSRAVSEAVSIYSEQTEKHRISGISVVPSLNNNFEEYWQREEKAYDDLILKLEKLRIAKRDTEQSWMDKKDMEDSLIPVLRSQIMKTFYERNETVLTDTIERFLGRINADVLARYVSELKTIRHDLLSKNIVNSPFLNFSNIDVVTSKDLFFYVVAIKSPYVTNLFYSNDWRPMANIENNSEPEEIMDELDLLEDLVLLADLSSYGIDQDQINKFDMNDESDIHLYSLAYDKFVVDSPALRFVVFSTLYFNEFNSEYTTYS